MLEVKLFFSIPKNNVSYDYYYKLHGFISKLLPSKSYGKNINEYVYTNLIGGENLKNGIKFNDNPYLIIRFDNNNNVLKRTLIDNIKKCVTLFDDIKIIGINWETTDRYKQNIFYTVKQSPIIIGQKRFKFQDFLSADELKECERLLFNSIKEKAKEMNFTIDENLEIKIMQQYNHKDINYRGIINKGRVFKLKISSNEETKKFILINGVGNSCGCGFGFINNKKI